VQVNFVSEKTRKKTRDLRATTLSDRAMEITTTLTVHRCRFVDFSPSSVTALAFPPLPLLSIKGKQGATAEGKVPIFGPLVVGRANGNIEIYEWTGSAAAAEAPQAWVLRKVREYLLDPLVPHRLNCSFFRRSLD
jgi:hypothetical protein